MMRLVTKLGSAALTILCAALIATPATAGVGNMLANPGFEDGPTGGGATSWISFGNAFTEASNPPQFVPFEGTQLLSMFGNFDGNFNVTGVFQEFPAAEGMSFQMRSRARHWSGDPMIGSQAAGGNWVVQKMSFKDAGDAEIGFSESIILDGSFATDTWHESGWINGVAPAGTVQVEVFILYLQPAFDGGAAHIDLVEFEDVSPVPTIRATWGSIKSEFTD